MSSLVRGAGMAGRAVRRAPGRRCRSAGTSPDCSGRRPVSRRPSPARPPSDDPPTPCAPSCGPPGPRPGPGGPRSPRSPRAHAGGSTAVPCRVSMCTACPNPPRAPVSSLTPGTARAAAVTRSSSPVPGSAACAGSGCRTEAGSASSSSRAVTLRSTSVTFSPRRSVAAAASRARSRSAVAGSGSAAVAAKSAVTRSGPGGSALGGGSTAASLACSGSLSTIRSASRRTPRMTMAARRSTASAASSEIHTPSCAPPNGSSLPSPT